MSAHTPKHRVFFLAGTFFLLSLAASPAGLGAQETPAAVEQASGAPPVPQPITVNGDTVEYLSDSKEVSATGNVILIYKGAKLTCQRLVVNTETKEAVAEGGVRLEDTSGIIEGEVVRYNFQNKTGVIVEPAFRMAPYFGHAEKARKVSDAEFVAERGYMSTCSFDNPHFRIKSRRMNFFPGEKVQAHENTLYLGRIPVGTIPKYERSLKEPFMHVQVSPGKSKDWGGYVLSAWRYRLTDNVSGRIYFDYRDKLGIASGFGANYATEDFGKGDLKFYQTNERAEEIPQGEQRDFQRHFVRWRHKWDIDERTNFVSEYYQISDEKRKIFGNTHNFLKDYFYREYEKGAEPLTYALLHRSFKYSSMDFLVQKRTNRWFDQIEKTPEIRYTMPSLQLGDSAFYFESASSFANFDKKVEVDNSDLTVTRLDTTNKISVPTRVSFVRLAPFVMSRQTFYDKDEDGNAPSVRTVFYTGTDVSTKFYRIFDVKPNFLGLDINGLRHIITPTIAYSYNHEPTVSAGHLKQIDSIDAITRSNAATLELSNKLQTKRLGKTVDMLDFRINSAYTFKPKGSGSKFSDFVFDLRFLPYQWLTLDTDATYNHREDHISSANYDLNFILGRSRSLGIGQRYTRKGTNEITMGFNWWLNPKWKFSVYERYNAKQTSTLNQGLREQEYKITRDLHCWIMEFAYNIKKDEGETIWFIFRIKAFPEMEFGFDQTYHSPKAGAQ